MAAVATRSHGIFTPRRSLEAFPYRRLPPSFDAPPPRRRAPVVPPLEAGKPRRRRRHGGARPFIILLPLVVPRRFDRRRQAAAVNRPRHLAAAAAASGLDEIRWPRLEPGLLFRRRGTPTGTSTDDDDARYYVRRYVPDVLVLVALLQGQALGAGPVGGPGRRRGVEGAVAGVDAGRFVGSVRTERLHVSQLVGSNSER